MIREYYTIVRTNRRITVPSDFQEGEPVKIRIERVKALEGEFVNENS